METCPRSRQGFELWSGQTEDRYLLGLCGITQEVERTQRERELRAQTHSPAGKKAERQGKRRGQKQSQPSRQGRAQAGKSVSQPAVLRTSCVNIPWALGIQILRLRPRSAESDALGVQPSNLEANAERQKEVM